jgi:hypothetical protein
MHDIDRNYRLSQARRLIIDHFYGLQTERPILIYSSKTYSNRLLDYRLPFDVHKQNFPLFKN